VATTQLLIRLPDALVRRFKRNASVRERSEKEHELAAEMADWEIATIADGLGDDDPPKKTWVREGQSTGCR
jgi:predicted transcriptional regulator